jgi:uncharacterized membrane protein
VLLPLSFYSLNKHLVGDWTSRVGPPLILGLVGLAVVFATYRTIPRRQAIPLGLALLMAVLPFMSAGCSSSSCADAAALLPTVLINVAMVAGAFWLMQIGLREDRGRPFGAGVLYFLVWSVMRYVDLFGNFGGMLGAALMFFTCGGALFVVARYWQGRKEVRYA